MKDFNLGIQHRIFNNEVRKRRLELGLTQKQLGKMVGFVQKIGAIENFRAYPNEEEAFKIAKILGTTIEILFPEWLEVFKPKQTVVVTEHFITDPLLANMNNSMLITDGEQQFEDMFDKKLIGDAIREGMKFLSDRERRVLEERFGLNGDQPKTLEEVGKMFYVSRNRIRQIEAKALRKLRHPARGIRDLVIG